MQKEVFLGTFLAAVGLRAGTHIRKKIPALQGGMCLALGMHAHGTCCPQPLAAPMGPWGAANKRLAPNKACKACKVGCKPNCPHGPPHGFVGLLQSCSQSCLQSSQLQSQLCSHPPRPLGRGPRPQLAHAARRAGAQNNKLRSSGAPTTHATGCAVLHVQHFFGWAQCWGLPTGVGVLGQHMHTVAGLVAVRLLVVTVHRWGPRCHRWWQLILCMHNDWF